MAKPTAEAASGAKPALPPLAPSLLADVRDQAARADREITDGYERQAVITTAAYLLGARRPAGRGGCAADGQPGEEPFAVLPDDAAWPRTPRKRGDATTALRWHREAFEKSEGPATRLQWGARYVGALVKFAPQDEAEIGRVAGQLLDEAAAQPNVFYERSARSLRRVSTQLRDWNRSGAHAAAMQQFDAHLARAVRARSMPPTASARPATRCRSRRRRRTPERARAGTRRAGVALASAPCRECRRT